MAKLQGRACEDAVIRKEGGKTDYRSCSSQIAARRSGDIIAAGRGFSADFRSYSEPGRSVMRYLLDTNIVSDLVRHPQGKLCMARLETPRE